MPGAGLGRGDMNETESSVVSVLWGLLLMAHFLQWTITALSSGTLASALGVGFQSQHIRNLGIEKNV